MVIVGAGAIGSWLALRLARVPDASVTLVARPERAAVLEKNGLTVETAAAAHPSGRAQEESVSVPPLHVVSRASQLVRTPDVVILCVRAYQTQEAARAMAKEGIRPAVVATLQNGLGNAETLAQVFGADRVVAGTTTNGVTTLEAGKVRHAGAGETVVGPWTPMGAGAAARVAGILSRAGVATTAVADPRPALWRKVAVNAAINPPTALLGIENGRLLDGGELEAALESAAREVAAVAVAEGVVVSADACAEAARAVAERTAGNLSSMLQARRAGRPLETDAILGEVVRRAARHGIPVPTVAGHLDRLGASSTP